MNRRFVGVIFCLISAILISIKYISAAIVVSGTGIYSPDLFKEVSHEIGGALNIFSLIALIIGVGYLFVSERNNESR